MISYTSPGVCFSERLTYLVGSFGSTLPLAVGLAESYLNGSRCQLSQFLCTWSSPVAPCQPSRKAISRSVPPPSPAPGLIHCALTGGWDGATSRQKKRQPSRPRTELPAPRQAVQCPPKSLHCDKQCVSSLMQGLIRAQSSVL